jgi:hypothetical protein
MHALVPASSAPSPVMNVAVGVCYSPLRLAFIREHVLIDKMLR